MKNDFAPAVKFSTIRLVHAVVALEDFELHQMDVKPSFSNGAFEEEVFTENPERCRNKRQSEFACGHLKPRCGLKHYPGSGFKYQINPLCPGFSELLI